MDEQLSSRCGFPVSHSSEDIAELFERHSPFDDDRASFGGSDRLGE
jgi:hypothetical protein